MNVDLCHHRGIMGNIVALVYYAAPLSSMAEVRQEGCRMSHPQTFGQSLDLPYMFPGWFS